MIPISKTVQQIVERSPVLREALVHDLINLSGLARYIQPEIEAKFLKPASIGSLVMALQRLRTKLRAIPSIQYLQQPIRADLSLRSDLGLFWFEYSSGVLKAYQLIAQQLNGKPEVFMSLSCGINEVACVINTKYADTVKQATSGLNMIGYTPNLSAITLRFLFDTIHAPGVYYRILQALAWENVNLIEIMSAANELTLIFDDDTIDSAFAVIKRLIKSV